MGAIYDPTKPNTIATVTTLIIAGFPGIGKTTCCKLYQALKPGCKVADLDVHDYGTTNGMNVSDPEAYMTKIENLVKDKYEIIFTTIDPVVREKMRRANLLYVMVAPEFPPEINCQMPPQIRSDALTRAAYMKRFDEIGGNKQAAAALEGRKYDDTLRDMFGDPFPKVVTKELNQLIIEEIWKKLDAQTRFMLSGLPTDVAASAAAQQNPGGSIDVKFPD